MSLGYLLGGGLLTKPPGLFSILTVPTSLAIFDFRVKDREKRVVKLAVLWGLAIIITLAIYNVLRLGPGFDNLSSRNEDYTFSPIRLLKYPIDPFIPHFHDLTDWLPKLLTWPIILLISGGLI